MTDAAPPVETTNKSFNYDEMVSRPVDTLRGAEMDSDGKVYVYSGESDQKIEVTEYKPGETDQKLLKFAAIDVSYSSSTRTVLQLGSTSDKSGYVTFDSTKILLPNGAEVVKSQYSEWDGKTQVPYGVMRGDTANIMQAGRLGVCEIPFPGAFKEVSRVHITARLISNGTKTVLLIQNDGHNGTALKAAEKPADTQLGTNETISLRV